MCVVCCGEGRPLPLCAEHGCMCGVYGGCVWGVNGGVYGVAVGYAWVWGVQSMPGLAALPEGSWAEWG